MKALNLVFFIAATAMCACGVRGRPLPPDKPTPIGHGEPSFKKATEKIILPKKKAEDESSENSI